MAQSASTIASDIAQYWATSLQRSRKKTLGFDLCCNRMYEDRILKGGDTVRINTIGDFTINTSHSRSANMTLNAINATDQTLVMDREDDYAFYLDEVDSVQAAAPVLDEASDRLKFNLRDAMDQYLASLMQAGTASANVLTARTLGTGGGDADAYELLVDLNKMLDINNVPEEDRFAIIPPWVKATLLKDPRRSSFGTTENLRAYGAGYLGRDVSGLEIFVSNNCVTSGSAYYVQAGSRAATTIAEQINKTAVKDNPLRMGVNVLGLHVFGGKVTRSSELANCLVTESTDI